MHDRCVEFDKNKKTKSFSTKIQEEKRKRKKETKKMCVSVWGEGEQFRRRQTALELLVARFIGQEEEEEEEEKKEEEEKEERSPADSLVHNGLSPGDARFAFSFSFTLR